MSEAADSKKAARLDPGQPPTRRQILLGGGHLAAIWALAFVQPLFDLLGKNPDFFVARGNTAGDILILAIGFTLVPPLILLAIEWGVSRLGPKAYWAVHFAFITLIAIFFFVQLIGDRLGARSAVILLVSLILAALLAGAIFRFTFVRNLMDILIAAPLVILLLFVFASKTSQLILPSDSKVEIARDSGDDHPVVLVIFDQLGTAHLMTDDRRIDATRYPNFARLSKDSTWYKNHSTTAFATPMAVPAILSGVELPPDTLPTYQDRPQSIFTQLGHDRPAHIFESVTSLCPPQVCKAEAGPDLTARLKSLASDLRYVEGRLVLPPRIAGTLPDVSSTFGNFSGGGQAGAAPQPKPGAGKQPHTLFVKDAAKVDPAAYEQFIHEIPQSSRGLTVMHFEVPHKPWQFDTEGRKYNASPIDSLISTDDTNTKNWATDANGIATAQYRMYVQTGYADRLVGMIRRQLVADGLWDKAMVVITADHGYSFDSSKVGPRRLDEKSLGEVANPPLFIKYPGQKTGETSHKHSLTLDIVPTIAEAVGVKDPYRMDGVPLQGPVPDRDVTLTSSLGQSVSISVDEMVKQRDQAIDRANRRLGTGPFYTLGPAPELVGRTAEPVPAGSTAARLDDPALWENYRPARDDIPMLVTGTTTILPGSDPDRAPIIAIAVNGRIEATGRVFAYSGANRFGALVNPATLRPGANRIGFYRVEGSRLIPLGGNQG